jgi:geranylgeranyl diphosphate synthase type II
MNINNYLEEKKHLIDIGLESILQPLKEHSLLYAAMSYSLLLGGKRIRPTLLIATFTANEKDEKSIIPFACAVEMIHTYSLIHDDLPIMDNSDMRRGHASCHKVYGSDMALLAGDALLTYAFEIISNPSNTINFRNDNVLKIINRFAVASGVNGLVGGQVMDMISTSDSDINQETITYIDRLKTGSLVTLSVAVGGILADVHEGELSALERFGENLGISYQVIDDILDETSSEELLGKDAGKDKKNRKATFVALYGVDRAKSIAQMLIDKGIDFLKPFGEKYKLLTEIAEFTISRVK